MIPSQAVHNVDTWLGLKDAEEAFGYEEPTKALFQQQDCCHRGVPWWPSG